MQITKTKLKWNPATDPVNVETLRGKYKDKAEIFDNENHPDLTIFDLKIMADENHDDDVDDGEARFMVCAIKNPNAYYRYMMAIEALQDYRAGLVGPSRPRKENELEENISKLKAEIMGQAGNASNCKATGQDLVNFFSTLGTIGYPNYKLAAECLQQDIDNLKKASASNPPEK